MSQRGFTKYCFLTIEVSKQTQIFWLPRNQVKQNQNPTKKWRINWRKTITLYTDLLDSCFLLNLAGHHSSLKKSWVHSKRSGGNAEWSVEYTVEYFLLKLQLQIKTFNKNTSVLQLLTQRRRVQFWRHEFKLFSSFFSVNLQFCVRIFVNNFLISLIGTFFRVCSTNLFAPRCGRPIGQFVQIHTGYNRH